MGRLLLPYLLSLIKGKGLSKEGLGGTDRKEEGEQKGKEAWGYNLTRQLLDPMAL